MKQSSSLMRQLLDLFLFHALAYKFDNLCAEEGYIEKELKNSGICCSKGLVTSLALS